ncbi:MAG: ABC transporter ATP-binding protein [Planctomycetaceae bacterium]|nr:ABC transporter ATP-binding protein [Planctomycetaceae bacterium]
MSIAIQCDSLCKQYRIGGQAPYQTIRESIVNSFTAPFRFTNDLIRKARGTDGQNRFWALKDVSFEVEAGDVVGVIGRNGAGKSTLLKLLTGITEPTAGHASIHGRVASLLEVGTGFHPELSGRENVYLNGAILGMKRHEIVKKFDDIVQFAEVEDFVDTAVKHYSSGMYLRLAFAVAAHLEPEILLVDEVLAVGDVGFQKKCMDKVSQLSRNAGRTILLVSHNMGAISTLCNRTILLEQGGLIGNGPTQEMISQYMSVTEDRTNQTLAERTDRRGDGRLQFTDAFFCNSEGQPIAAALSGDDVQIALRFQVQDNVELRSPLFKFFLRDTYGNMLFICSSKLTGDQLSTITKGGIAYCSIPRLPLVEGEYFLEINCAVDGYHYVDDITDAAKITVVRGDYFGTQSQYKHPYMYIDHKWSVVQDR